MQVATKMYPAPGADDASQPDRDKRIRAAQERAKAKMQSGPEKARSTTATTGVVADGLTCQITQGRFAAVTDLGPGMGGDAAGPSPSFFARAAVAGCIAIAVKMLAASMGKRFRRVEVSVETDFDDLALFGVGPSSAAPLETRISIRVESDEAHEDVAAIVDTALERDPWFLALKDAQKVATMLEVARPSVE